MSLVHCCSTSLPLAPQWVLPASGLLWISSPDSLCFISLLTQNHLLPAFSIKGSLCVLIANDLVFDYYLLLFSSSFLLATRILGSLHQYHNVKMQTPGPTADQSNQDSGYGARASALSQVCHVVFKHQQFETNPSAALWRGNTGDCSSYGIRSQTCRHRFILAPYDQSKL